MLSRLPASLANPSCDAAPLTAIKANMTVKAPDQIRYVSSGVIGSFLPKLGKPELGKPLRTMKRRRCESKLANAPAGPSLRSGDLPARESPTAWRPRLA